MKKVVGLFLVGVFLFSMFSVFVMADDETEEEVEVMSSNYGAKMRLLQLELALRVRVAWGNEAIDILRVDGEDVSELEEIVEDLEALIEEVQSLSSEATQENVEAFIEIRSEAKELVTEFKDLSKDKLNLSKKDSLRKKHNYAQETEYAELRQQIEEQRRLLKAEIAANILADMGVEDEDLLEDITSGKINLREARHELRDYYDSLSAEDQEAFRMKIRERHVNRRVLSKSRMGRVVKTRKVGVARIAKARRAQDAE